MKERPKNIRRFLRSKIRINKKVLSFILTFMTLLAIFYFVSIEFEGYIPIFSMRHTAEVLHFLLNSAGMQNNLDKYNITFSNFSLTIVRQCTGIFELMAVISCILAFPSPVKKKLVGIAMALPIIYGFNMARLIFLSALGINYPSVFEVVHDYILQLSFVFLVVFFWIYWINRVVKGEK
jgi:archaeosortase B (VPXXXP-CTERM-specific)